MKNLILLFTSLINILHFTSCSKEDTKCDGCECQFPVTESGENTFSCKIEGEPWSACTKLKGNVLGGGNNKPIEFYWDQNDGWNYIKISSHRYFDKVGETIQLIIREPQIGKINKLNPYNSTLTVELGETSIFNPGCFSTYYLDTTQNYEIDIIKLDLSKRIFSGLFNGYVKSKKTGCPYDEKILAITDGQFDVKF